jgi:hypothetical protein
MPRLNRDGMVKLADSIGIGDGNLHRWSQRLCDLSKRTAHFKDSLNLVETLIVLLSSLCRVEFRGGLCRHPNGYIPSLQASAVPRPSSLTTAPAHHFPFAEQNLQPLGSLPRCPHPGSPCCHVPLDPLAHHRGALRTAGDQPLHAACDQAQRPA